jgi:hypothetical protein
MREWGLVVRPDVTFGHVSDEGRFPSLRLAPTTKATGLPFRPGHADDPTSEVHVFVGRRDADVDAAWRSGWYPVVVHGRIVQKPKIDHVRFGHCLGYPDCCVRAFERFNRWGLYDHITESRRTSGAFPFVNNCFAKYTPYMLAFHIPCRFDCEASRRMGEAILAGIDAMDPGFGARMRAHLLTPVLHVSERLNFGLVGARCEDGDVWRYDAVDDIYARITGRDRRHDMLKRLLDWGTALRLIDRHVLVTNAAGEERPFVCRVDDGVIENPAIFCFDDPR